MNASNTSSFLIVDQLNPNISTGELGPISTGHLPEFDFGTSPYISTGHEFQLSNGSSLTISDPHLSTQSNVFNVQNGLYEYVPMTFQQLGTSMTELYHMSKLPSETYYEDEVNTITPHKITEMARLKIETMEMKISELLVQQRLFEQKIREIENIDEMKGTFIIKRIENDVTYFLHDNNEGIVMWTMEQNGSSEFQSKEDAIDYIMKYRIVGFDSFQYAEPLLMSKI